MNGKLQSFAWDRRSIGKKRLSFSKFIYGSTRKSAHAKHSSDHCKQEPGHMDLLVTRLVSGPFASSEDACSLDSLANRHLHLFQSHWTESKSGRWPPGRIAGIFLGLLGGRRRKKSTWGGPIPSHGPRPNGRNNHRKIKCHELTRNLFKHADICSNTRIFVRYLFKL